MNKFKITRLYLMLAISLSSNLLINTMIVNAAPAQTNDQPNAQPNAQKQSQKNDNSNKSLNNNKVSERTYSEYNLTLPDPSTVIVYKYIDNDGRVHYTDTPPKKYQDSAKVINEKSKEVVASISSLRSVSNSNSALNYETDWKLKDKEFKERQAARQKLEDQLDTVHSELRSKEAGIKTEPTEEDYEKVGRVSRRVSPDFYAKQEALKKEIEELKNKEREIKNEIAYPKVKAKD